MAAERVVIVGGGAAGSIVASRLGTDLRDRVADGRLRVQLLTERDDHLYQPGLLYVGLGLGSPEELHRRESSLLPPGVETHFGRVTAVDRDRREVVTEAGDRFPYDHLVLATGSIPDPAAIPGLPEGGHEFYTEAGALRLAAALDRFEGGRIVLTVGVPHKCPVAPLEFVYMLHDRLQSRGLRGRTEILYTYPLGRVHSLESCAPWAEELMRARDIRIETFVNMDRVDPERRVVSTMEGEDIPYDLLVAIPPHHGADFLAGSGLAGPGNWIATDLHTLQVRGADEIYALGDCTDLPISKAGSTAHYEAEVVAANLADRIRGGTGGRRYDGKVFCFIETGGGEASYVAFDYDHAPHPTPSSRLLHMFKLAFNRVYWLTPQGIL
jgi:sulfide:quinone oxidoreductase